MLIDCRECGAKISDAAVSCPQCGVPDPARKPEPAPAPKASPAPDMNPGRPEFYNSRKPKASNRNVLIGVGAGLVALVALGTQLPKGEPRTSSTSPIESPSASASASPVDDGSSLGALSVASLKASLRNPDSLTVESVLAAPAGKYVCILYRAQNGFGGMNRDHVVFTEAGGDPSVGTWNRKCAHRQLKDVTSTAVSLSHAIG